MKKSLFAAIAICVTTAAMANPGMGPGSDRFDWKTKNLTRAEALELAGKHFDAMDSNKDGIVTPEERHQAFEKFSKDHPRGEPRGHGKKPGFEGPPPDAPPQK